MYERFTRLPAGFVEIVWARGMKSTYVPQRSRSKTGSRRWHSQYYNSRFIHKFITDTLKTPQRENVIRYSRPLGISDLQSKWIFKNFRKIPCKYRYIHIKHRVSLCKAMCWLMLEFGHRVFINNYKAPAKIAVTSTEILCTNREMLSFTNFRRITPARIRTE